MLKVKQENVELNWESFCSAWNRLVWLEGMDWAMREAGFEPRPPQPYTTLKERYELLVNPFSETLRRMIEQGWGRFDREIVKGHRKANEYYRNQARINLEIDARRRKTEKRLGISLASTFHPACRAKP